MIDCRQTHTRTLTHAHAVCTIGLTDNRIRTDGHEKQKRRGRTGRHSQIAHRNLHAFIHTTSTEQYALTYEILRRVRSQFSLLHAVALCYCNFSVATSPPAFRLLRAMWLSQPPRHFVTNKLAANSCKPQQASCRAQAHYHYHSILIYALGPLLSSSLLSPSLLSHPTPSYPVLS